MAHNEQARKGGYVYILTNPAMPGLVKIGSTTLPPVDTWTPDGESIVEHVPRLPPLTQFQHPTSLCGEIKWPDKQAQGHLSQAREMV